MKNILIACVVLFLTGVLSAQEASIASKYNLFTGEVDTVDYKAGTMALYAGLGLGSGDYEQDTTVLASGTDERDAGYGRLEFGFNWAPLDNIFLSLSIFGESLNLKGRQQLLAGGSLTTVEFKKDSASYQVSQLQVAAKQDIFGGGFKLRHNRHSYEFEYELDYLLADDATYEGEAEASYVDVELYVTSQFIPQLSAGLAYSPEVSEKSEYDYTPTRSTDSYYLVGHGAQTKVHALLAPIDILGIRLDYIKEAENKSSDDAAATTTKLGAYVLAGPGIIAADYSSKISDGYEIDSEEATEGKSTQRETKETTLGFEFQMVATDNIHLDFRFESYNAVGKKLSDTNGEYNLSVFGSSITFLYVF